MRVRWITGALLAVAGLVGVADAYQVRLKLGRKTTAPPAATSARGPQSSIVCSGTAVAAGASIQTAVDGAAAGTTFCLGAGIHRQQTVTPKANQQFIGDYGAVMNGSKVLSSWTQDGARWYATGQTQTQHSPLVGECYPEYPMCQNPEDLWFNGTLKRRVSALTDVTAGTWFLDYSADRIYVGDNPTSFTVETSTTANLYAFTGSASGVVIKNLTIEKYAAPAQVGAVHGLSGTSWVVQNNTVQHNHGIGIRGGPSMLATLNIVQFNYQLGVGGTFNSGTVDDNEIAFNNVQYNYGWEGGGTKFTFSNGLTVSDNFVHHNLGPGIWFDIDNINFTVSGNTSEDNSCGNLNAACPGIFIEISYGGSIFNNTVRRNGLAFNPFLWGAGILIAASGGNGIEIYSNTVEDNGDGITLIQQPRGGGAFGQYLVQNVYVHDNTVKDGIGTSGAAADFADPGLFVGRNNRFESNTYLNAGTCNRFSWNFTEFQSFTTWQNSYGNDSPVGSCTVY